MPSIISAKLAKPYSAPIPIAAADLRDFSTLELNAPATRTKRPSSAIAARCTPPINAPSPPPIIPSDKGFALCGTLPITLSNFHRFTFIEGFANSFY
jgi:hypothetical protein